MRAARPLALVKASAMRWGPSMGASKPTTSQRPMLAAPVTDAANMMPGPRGRRVLTWFVSTAVLILVVYLLIPRLAGLEHTWQRIKDGSPAWLAAAVIFECLSYLGYAWNVSAVSAADGVVLGVRRAALITLGATAATRLVAAGGAGGIAVTTWALSRAGHGPKQAAKQVSSHLVATYAVFVGAIIVVGTGLAIAGAPPLLTAVPAVLGALLMAAYGVAIQAPDALARRLGSGGRWRRRLLAAPQALADGTHFTVELLRRREIGLLGTVLWW